MAVAVAQGQNVDERPELGPGSGLSVDVLPF
jgi:hypothetical protein